MMTGIRWTFAVLAAVLALAWSQAAHAADAEPLVLTLEEAIALAAEQGHEVQKAREYGALVEGRYVEERSAALPQFTVAAGVSRVDDESQAGLGPPRRTDSSSVLLTVTQPIFTWGQIPAAIRAADIGRATATDRLATAQSTARRDAAIAFTDVLLARELEALAIQNLEQKQRHLEEARRRLAAGTATDYDVLAAQVTVENARPERIRMINRVQATRDRLAFILGLRERAVDVTGSLEVAPGPVPDPAEALLTAVARRPDLAELRKNHQVAAELVRIAAAGNKPRLDLGADAGWRTVDLDGNSGEGNTWSAELLLRWPIFDGGRTRGAVARAKSDARTVGLEIEKFVDTLALETRTAVDAVREATAIVEALGGTVAQSERLLAMAEQGFALGVKTRLDVDDAQLNVIEARAGLARGRRDLLVFRITLEWIMGTL
jgi:HAE1 family hydrophobic/amphiphilic exporter-1